MNRFDSESAVIGACLIDPQAYWKIADLLSAEDFAIDSQREIFRMIADMQRDRADVDVVTVAERLPELAAEISQTCNATPGSTNVRAYAESVVRSATERRVRQAGQRIAKLSGADSLGEAQKILGACQPKAVGAVRSMREFVTDALVMMQQRCDSTEVLTGVPTSLPWLDEQTSGWQRGDLIILAARPSVGKTAMALQCALHAAGIGAPVFFASLEQSGLQLAERSLAHLANVPLPNIMQPKRAEPEDWTRITEATVALKCMPLSVDETGALSVDAICARARQVNADKRLGLIVIDYLTQITPPRAEKTTDAVQIITRTLKALAKELGVPVILISQLNRDGTMRPELKHLRDSGAIEQDADVVVFLHRPDENRRDLIELIVAKQRNGPCDSTFLAAHMDRMRFVQTDDRPMQQTRNVRGFGTYASRTAQQ